MQLDGEAPDQRDVAAPPVTLGAVPPHQSDVFQHAQVMREQVTGLPELSAAGDCVITHHRQLGVTYLPWGTTAHKQGRVAGANAVGGRARFAGSVGTQVVKVFDLVVARTGLRDHEASPLGHEPLTVTSSPNDHKA